MNNYVLVHGGNNTGNIWDAFVPFLHPDKNRVFCPTLSDPEKSTLPNHIHEVCQLIFENGLEDVILVGHSYGGMVITGVADRIPERIKQLVYLDAALPQNGESLFDILNATGHDAQTFYGITPLRPFTDPLPFDAQKLDALEKSYILCTTSEFLRVSKMMFDRIQKAPPSQHWTTYTIISSHHAMRDHPQELAEIFSKIEGMKIN